MGIRPTAAAGFIPERELSCERQFTDGKLSVIDSGSDNGCSFVWEGSLFSWSESAHVSGRIALADLNSTSVFRLARHVAQHIFQYEHGQSQLDLLGFDFGRSLFHFSLPLQVRHG